MNFQTVYLNDNDISKMPFLFEGGYFPPPCPFISIICMACILPLFAFIHFKIYAIMVYFNTMVKSVFLSP